VSAQASFHADDARLQLPVRVFETQSPDLLPEGNLPVDAKPDNVKNLLADVDADHRQGRCARFCLRFHSCFSCLPLLAFEG